MTSIDKNRRLELLADKSFNSSANRAEAIKNCDYAEVMVEAIDTFCVDDINIEWYNFFYKLPAKLIGRAIDRLQKISLPVRPCPIYAVLANKNISDVDFSRLEKFIDVNEENIFICAFQYIQYYVSDKSCAKIANLMLKNSDTVSYFLEFDFSKKQNYRILMQALLQNDNKTSELVSGIGFLCHYFGQFVIDEIREAQKYYYYVLCIHIFLKYDEQYYIDELNPRDYLFRYYLK